MVDGRTIGMEYVFKEAAPEIQAKKPKSGQTMRAEASVPIEEQTRIIEKKTDAIDAKTTSIEEKLNLILKALNIKGVI